MTERTFDQLSEAGCARRDAMLGPLLDEMRGLHARKRMRRRAAVMACAGVALAAVIMLAMPRPSAPPSPHFAQSPESSSSSPPSVEPISPHRAIVNVQVVHTDPTTVERYIVRTASHRGILLTDEELLDTLEDIGRPTGLVRMNGRVWLTASVVDKHPR